VYRRLFAAIATAACVAIALGVRPAPLRADILLSYTFDYTAGASFFCSSAYSAYCSTNATSLTLTNGTGAATFGFAGTSGELGVVRGDATPFLAGSILQSFTGDASGFTYPFTGNYNVPLFGVRINLDETSPVVGTGGWFAYAWPLRTSSSDLLLAWYTSNWTTLPIPAGYTSSVLILSTSADAYALSTDGTPVEIRGFVGIAPEPSSVVLMATGLCALLCGAFVKRRRGVQR
jgi:hypothetical protein